MGGGDLNMKKSWHPIKIQNVEKVWKAEQRDKLERDRINQLIREREEERQKEEMQMLARGRKGGANRLEWMYAGAGQHQSSGEEFLLGKKLEKLPGHEEEEAQKQALASAAGSLLASAGPSSNDLAAKIREDPMYLIKKRQKDQIMEVRNNPVKMAELRKMLGKDKKKDKKGKKAKKEKKKKKDKRSDGSESEGEKPSHTQNGIDSSIGPGFVHPSRMASLPEQSTSIKHRDRSPASSRDHKNDRDYEDRARRHRDEDRRPLRPRSRSPPRRHRDRSRSRDRYRRSRSRTPPPSSSSRRRSRSRSYSSPRRTDKGREERRRSRSPVRSQNGGSRNHGRPHPGGTSSKMDAEERARKLAEMQNNAKETEEDRDRRIAAARQKDRDEEERERLEKEESLRRNGESGEAHFIKGVRKDAVQATAMGTLEDRINRNRSFIQRTNADLGKGLMSR